MGTEDLPSNEPHVTPCADCNALLIGAASTPHANLRLTGFRQPGGEETYRCLDCRLRLAFRQVGRKTRWFKVYL